MITMRLQPACTPAAAQLRQIDKTLKERKDVDAENRVRTPESYDMSDSVKKKEKNDLKRGFFGRSTN